MLRSQSEKRLFTRKRERPDKEVVKMLLEEPRFAPLAKKRMSDTQVCVFLAEKVCLFLWLGNEPANREGCPAAETLSSVAGIGPLSIPMKN